MLSLLRLIARASKPGMRRLGKDPSADVWVDIDRYPVIQIAQELRSQGISLAVAHLEHSIGALWTRAGAIGPDRVFETVREAVHAFDATRPATPAATSFP